MEGDYNGYFQSKKELKENIARVHTQRSSGNHGYMGNILSDDQYALISPDTPFVAPPLPYAVPTMVIPRGTTDIVSGNTLL